jgi:hypothetical protein
LFAEVAGELELELAEEPHAAIPIARIERLTTFSSLLI